MSSTLDRILKNLEDADEDSVKTAAAETSAPPDTQAALLQTVQNLTKTAATTSQPSNGSPVQDLQKMASDAQAAEIDLLTKQSQFLGAAVADGFMQRFAQYDTALTTQGVKTASGNVDANAVKEIAKQAYVEARYDMEKQASAEYQQGYEDQMNAIHKIASDLHYNGQMLANHIVSEARKSESK